MADQLLDVVSGAVQPPGTESSFSLPASWNEARAREALEGRSPGAQRGERDRNGRNFATPLNSVTEGRSTVGSATGSVAARMAPRVSAWEKVLGESRKTIFKAK